MKIVINGVDVTNDCVVKNDTIIFCGGHWPPESLPSTGEDDMTAKEFFDSPESPITLDKICTPTEK